MKKFYFFLQAVMAFCISLSVVSCEKDKTPDDPQGDSFNFKMTEITAISAKCNVTPLQEGKTYITGYIKAADYVSDEAIALHMASASGAEKAMVDHAQEFVFTSLEENTDYYVYAFYIEKSELGQDNPKYKGFSKFAFKTVEKPAPNTGFTIEISELTATTAASEVKPTRGNPKFWNYYVTEKQFIEYNLADPDFFLAFVKETLDYNASWMGITVQELVLKVREEKYSFQMWDGLAPDTKYYAFAAEIDDDAFVLNNNYAYKAFQTLKPEITDFNIDMKVTECTESTATVEYRPNNEEQVWFSHYMTKMEFDQFGSDKAVLDAAMEMFGHFFNMGIGLYAGSGKITFTKLSPETEYVFFAFGYDSNMSTYNSELFTATGTTEKAEEIDGDMGVTFDFNINVIDSETAEITTTPSDMTVTYITDVIKKDVYEQYGGTPDGLKAFWKNQLSEFKDMGMTEADVVLFLGIKGEDTFKYETLREKSDYVVYGFHVDEIGRLLSKPSAKEFSTPAEGEAPKAAAMQQFMPMDPMPFPSGRIVLRNIK